LGLLPASTSGSDQLSRFVDSVQPDPSSAIPDPDPEKSSDCPRRILVRVEVLDRSRLFSR